MYDFDWDTQTGGYRLLTNQVLLPREIRPVYAKELDLFGFNQYWKYEAQNDIPYMWADNNTYWYRGVKVATLHKAAAFNAPTVEINASITQQLEPIDIKQFIQKNSQLINILSNETIRNIYNCYTNYKQKVDIFYVAFSGGKDSILALDLVQRALPHNKFKVIFGDTQMEFCDTYKLISHVEEYCKEHNIEFLQTKSELQPEKTWRLVGPPSQTLRWCCSILKTVPQIIKLREITNKPNVIGMAITGIRASESGSRSEYDEINDGKKILGQYSFHPILNWNSAEVFAYIFQHNLLLNEAYKLGNSRVGCLVCPMATSKNIFVKEQCYKSQTEMSYGTDIFNKVILDTTSKVLDSNEAITEYLNIGGWKARRSGQELNFTKRLYCDEIKDNSIQITADNLTSDWKEWIKTIGNINFTSDNSFTIEFNHERYNIKYSITNNNHCEFTIEQSIGKDFIKFLSLFKSIIRKSIYCIKCRLCEVSCPHGFISMNNNYVIISDKCVKCHKCLSIPNGCLVANSLRLPKGENKMGKSKSLNPYANMGFENSWILNYFKHKENIWASVDAPGNNKDKYLKTFLLQSGISNKNYTLSPFGSTIEALGLNTITSWGLIITNLAYYPLFHWWFKKIVPDVVYEPYMIFNMIDDSTSDNSKKHTVSAFKHIFISNEILGKDLGIGVCDYSQKNGLTLNSVYRTKWLRPDARVILYSLYKFAEACGDYYQFTLARLLDHSIESDGVSPTQIFCLTKEDMEPMLKGLAINYPEFISASFTHDLDNIKLNPDKSSSDVLALFK
ncbi:MAG: phosphoadenosine phosphosulfate reductase family protein [Proteobacteria bacterium]|nr:phosphoadenosine phosphosulfate reductase family protein [Pseudomonadota bacterium]